MIRRWLARRRVRRLTEPGVKRVSVAWRETDGWTRPSFCPHGAIRWPDRAWLLFNREDEPCEACDEQRRAALADAEYRAFVSGRAAFWRGVLEGR